MKKNTTKIPGVCALLDRFILMVGTAASWLNAVLIAVIILQVVMRYAFGHGLVFLEEIQWHLYAVAFMIGMSYVLTTDSNVRLDIAYCGFSERKKEWIEFLGIIFLLMPFIIIFFLHSIDFVENSWRVNEHSDAPMGLPWRWVIKSVIPVSFSLLFISAVSRLIKAANFLFGGKKEVNHGNQ